MTWIDSNGCIDKKIFCGEVNTTEKKLIYMKKVSSGKKLKRSKFCSSTQFNHVEMKA